MKGQKMLKVCSILMIIAASIGLAAAIVVALGVSALVGGLSTGEVTLVVLATIVACVGGVIQLVAGIVGVKAANMPSVGKIKAAFVLGIVVILLSLYSNIYSGVTSGFDTTVILGLILGLVLPGLYMAGLIQYKNALLELLSGD